MFGITVKEKIRSVYQKLHDSHGQQKEERKCHDQRTLRQRKVAIGANAENQDQQIHSQNLIWELHCPLKVNVTTLYKIK